jgi:hypothetical protein
MSLEERIKRLEAAVFGGAGTSAKTEVVNIDDPKHGNPVIKYEDRKWTGPSKLGRTYSQAGLEWLEFHADSRERLAAWKDRQDDEETRKRASWDRREAAKMRAWIERLRANPQRELADLPDDELPF